VFLNVVYTNAQNDTFLMSELRLASISWTEQLFLAVPLTLFDSH